MHGREGKKDCGRGLDSMVHLLAAAAVAAAEWMLSAWPLFSEVSFLMDLGLLRLKVGEVRHLPSLYPFFFAPFSPVGFCFSICLYLCYSSRFSVLGFSSPLLLVYLCDDSRS